MHPRSLPFGPPSRRGGRLLLAVVPLVAALLAPPPAAAQDDGAPAPPADTLVVRDTSGAHDTTGGGLAADSTARRAGLRRRAGRVALRFLNLPPFTLERMRSRQPSVFLERSYISYPYSLNEYPGPFDSRLRDEQRYLFEGAGSLHLYIINGLVNPGLLDEGGRTVTLSVSFLPVVRMFDDPSDPVRTPSYRIRPL